MPYALALFGRRPAWQRGLRDTEARPLISTLDEFLAEARVVHESDEDAADLRGNFGERGGQGVDGDQGVVGKDHTQALLCIARRRADVLFAMLRDGTFYEPQLSAAVT
ncbi:hypothetical protein [Streptomyces sp. NPDC000961]|uniref:hypothetical protein n=1 Tax=Streptomyces sp. NPDC000961 TaxID=3364541 RepID=UPI0036AC8300